MPAIPEAPEVYHRGSMGPAARKGYNQDYGRIQRVSFNHDAVIDKIIEHPEWTNGQLAREFKFTEVWMSRVVGSDAFQVRLAERKAELVDPFIRATVDDKLRALADQSLDVIASKLEMTQNPDLALKALDLTSKALGFGARNSVPAVQTNNYVVHMPQKAPSSAEWAANYAGTSVEAKSMSSTVGRNPLVQPETMKLAKE